MQRKQNVKYALAGSVALATIIVYLAALRNDFVEWDDNLYAFANPHIRSFDLAFFRWAFFDFYASNWHPLTWMSHALDYAIWGLNPLGHHLTNIILHAINTFLVVMLVIRLLDAVKERTPGSERAPFLTGRSILIAAGATGLLFGLHPVHVESVAWVAERKDLLCALFFLLSIIGYAKYVSSVNVEAAQINPYRRLFNQHYLLALIFFILALLSKPMAVTLPVVLLVLDWYPFNRIESFKTFRSALVEKLPFIALSLTASIVTILAQRSTIAPLELVPLSTRLLVAINSLNAYLGKMLWPLNLLPYYPYPKDVSLFSLEYLSAIALVMGIIATCIVIVKKHKLWLTAWGYYVATLIPVIGIVQVGRQSMADRYTYLPSLGPFLVVGLAMTWFFLKRRGLIVKVLCAAAFVLVFVAMSYLTLRQIGIWKNSIDLWSYAIEKEPEKVPLAYINRASAFYRTNQLDKAIADYDRAIVLEPNNDHAYNNRGIVFVKMGQVEKAIADYDRGIALNPLNYEAYFNLGVLYGRVGLSEKAIGYFNQSITLNPDHAESYKNRGLSYFYAGQYDSALKDFNKSIELDQNSATAYFSRGDLYLKTGNQGLALADYRKACDLGYEKGCNAVR
jgi:Tfp pilus assembly protein PilF